MRFRPTADQFWLLQNRVCLNWKNLTPRQMRSVQDVAHARIYSRVLEMCTPILLQGADRRKSISNGKRVLAKQILFPQKEVQPNGKTE